jgi:hypothetical protein
MLSPSDVGNTIQVGFGEAGRASLAEGDLMLALTDLEICTIGLCGTIVLCTIGPAASIYHHLRRTALHISHQMCRSVDLCSERSDGRIAERLDRLQTAVEAQH